jgi:hypothetical protein
MVLSSPSRASWPERVEEARCHERAQRRGDEDAGRLAGRHRLAAEAQVDESGEDEEGDERRGRQPRHKGAPAPAPVGRDEDGADGPDGRRFGRRRDAAEDRAEHGHDEHHRRHHRTQERGERRGAEAAFLRRQGGRQLRPQPGDEHLVEHVEEDEQQSGHDRAGEQVSHRHGLRREVAERELRALIGGAELVAEHDEHDGWRDDLAQGAGSRDGARGERARIAVAQHRRQRHQPHGDDRGADDARRRGKQRPDDEDRKAEPAAHCAEQAGAGVDQLLRDARALQHHAHQHEERDGDQHVVGHDAVDALGERLQEGIVHGTRRHADGEEDESTASESEGHGKAGEEQREGAAEHGEAEDVLQHVQRSPLPAASAANALSAMEMPCTASSTAKAGISVLSR